MKYSINSVRLSAEESVLITRRFPNANEVKRIQSNWKRKPLDLNKDEANIKAEAKLSSLNPY